MIVVVVLVVVPICQWAKGSNTSIVYHSLGGFARLRPGFSLPPSDQGRPKESQRTP